MTSRVCWLESTGNPSIGTILPLSRIAGGNPAVRWTSEARASTMRRRTSAKSKSMEARSSFRPDSSIPETDEPRSGGDTEDLPEAGHPRTHLVQPVLAQGQHPLFASGRRDLRLGRQGDGHVLDPLAHRHHREDADPAPVA